MSDITIRRLLEAGCHFGHQTRYWCPRMAPYIFGERNNLHIIDLEQTLPMINEAMNYLGAVAAQGGKVLFVGTKRQASRLIEKEAKRCNSPYVNFRWLGGMLTNFKTIRKSVSRLKEMDEMVETGSVNKLVKKEILQFNRERAKLEKSLSGIKQMNGLPDVLFVIDREYDYIAVKEANKLGIPVVSIVDSNCSPVGIDYVIPGNDDAIRSIRLYLSAAADAINDSRLEALTAEAEALSSDTVEETEVVVEKDEPAKSKPIPKEPKQEDKKVVLKKSATKKIEVKKPTIKKVDVTKAKALPATDKKPVSDKLTDINGIGPVIEGKLIAMGITTIKQIAEFDAEKIKSIDTELNFKGRIEREAWVEQAKKLA